MLFNSFVFLLAFLPVTYFVFWVLRSANQRYVWLTITGYVFYGWWDARFCLLMAFSTIVSFTAGLGFLRWSSPRRRRLCLVIPIVVDLSLLGFFKYANFTADSVARLLTAVGLPTASPHLDIVLPIGISFYTFHTITYIVDSYRGVIRPTKNFFEFASYVSLFSQLVAGPIVRFRQIEQDLNGLGTADRRRWLTIGVSYFVTGLVEKVAIADTLAGFVDPMLAHYLQLSSLGAWGAMLGYTFQLYFDFAGYSSMAIGLGYMFGLRIPVNFNSPYKALDPSDFWRRWHISLSTCLRDYLYIPLGGSRGGTEKTYRNLMITMLLGGLWHGAAWTFVAWGAYHGALLSLHRGFGGYWDVLPKPIRQTAMFFLAVCGWVLFRSNSFGMAAHLLAAMFIPTQGVVVADGLLVVAMLAFAGAWSILGPNEHDLHAKFSWSWPRVLVLSAAFGVCIALMAGGGSSPFLYFQF